MDFRKLLRAHLRDFRPYTSARHEIPQEAKTIFMDANENALGSPLEPLLNRYPDPLQNKLKRRIASLKHVDEKNIFLGNGSDEAIDLLVRAFCEPSQERIVLMPPTYGMYEVAARMNNIGIEKIPLLTNFQMDIQNIMRKMEGQNDIKIIFICSPNNPTGNVMNAEDVEKLLKTFGGLVIVDEAYIDYSRRQSWLNRLDAFPNLVVLQTFSKAWGLARIRLGMAFGQPQLIAILNQIKYPYNVSGLTQETALSALNHVHRVQEMIQTTLAQRDWLQRELSQLSSVEQVFPSQTNFLLLKVKNAGRVYGYLLQKGIVVRNRSGIMHCPSCLRITVGTPAENKRLIESFKEMEKSS